jgi:hypothetical protein
VLGRRQIVAPLALDFAVALGAALDHGDHGEVGKDETWAGSDVTKPPMNHINTLIRFADRVNPRRSPWPPPSGQLTDTGPTATFPAVPEL